VVSTVVYVVTELAVIDVSENDSIVVEVRVVAAGVDVIGMYVVVPEDSDEVGANIVVEGTIVVVEAVDVEAAVVVSEVVDIFVETVSGLIFVVVTASVVTCGIVV